MALHQGPTKYPKQCYNLLVRVQPHSDFHCWPLLLIYLSRYRQLNRVLMLTLDFAQQLPSV